MNTRKCGILLHPTSLPSPYGIGDFGKNAFAFVDFLKNSKQRLWQVLPFGTISFGNSPYQSFSAFAGNFYLICPEILQEEKLLTKEDLLSTPIFDETRVDYGQVIPYKTLLFKKAFKNFVPTEKYLAFCKENAFWLEDYALFLALKDFYIEKRKTDIGSPEYLEFFKETSTILTKEEQNNLFYGGAWQTFEKPLATRDKAAVEKAKTEHLEKINYYKFLQFKFFQQWFSLKAYAKKNAVEIIGDIPIFVALDSSDVWANPELFTLTKNGYPTLVAGVPPDYFSPTGQLWGNPLYNWDEHKKQGYTWWINRLSLSLKLWDTLRIDHFRGFESYFAIPFGSEDATKGTWIKSCGKELFDALKKHLGTLPIIAEDLGIITPQVTQLREDCQFPGMKVLHFAFDQSPNNDYLPHNYEKNTVVYTGTHDNDTSKGWYETASEEERDNFRRYTNTSGENPQWDMIRLAISSTAQKAIYPLQDVLSLGQEGRMNTPGTLDGNWQWRFCAHELLPIHEESLGYLATIFKRV